MKKLAFILALVMCLSVALVACDSTDTESTPADTSSAAPAESETPAEDKSEAPVESTEPAESEAPAEESKEEAPAGAPEYTVGDDGNASYSTAVGYTFVVDGFDGNAEVAETTRICTSLDTIGTSWGIYAVIEKTGDNTYKAVTDGTFMAGTAVDVELAEGQLFFVAHSSTSNPDQEAEYPNWQDKIALMAVKAGDVFTFAGVDFDALSVEDATVTIG